MDIDFINIPSWVLHNNKGMEALSTIIPSSILPTSIFTDSTVVHRIIDIPSPEKNAASFQPISPTNTSPPPSPLSPQILSSPPPSPSSALVPSSAVTQPTMHVLPSTQEPSIHEPPTQSALVPSQPTVRLSYSSSVDSSPVDSNLSFRTSELDPSQQNRLNPETSSNPGSQSTISRLANVTDDGHESKINVDLRMSSSDLAYKAFAEMFKRDTIYMEQSVRQVSS
ncbi:hypothetical protein Dimus_000818 [Dionaea muscipula]